MIARPRHPDDHAHPPAALTLALALAPTESATTSTALARLEALCDPGSLQLIRTEVVSSAMGAKARAGDGVLGGAGTVDGRPVFCYAQDASYAGGSLGEAHADTIARVLELADRGRAPVVGFVASGGARMQEGVAALGGYGRIFRRTVALSGRVPADLDRRRAVGGRRRLLAGADRLGRDDRLGEHVPDRARRRSRGARRGRRRRELGGTRVHGRNGVCHFVADDDHAAALLARDLLGYLPSHRDEPAPARSPQAPAGRDPGLPVPCPTPRARLRRPRRARRGSSTAARCWRSHRRGRATSSAASPASTAAASA